jgi:hypothetical protein
MKMGRRKCPRSYARCNGPQRLTVGLLHFEFTVEPLRGRGTPSYTDLMVQSESLCLAIEAKWTEPIYNSVSSWLHGKVKSASPDEMVRLLGRCSRGQS